MHGPGPCLFSEPRWQDGRSVRRGLATVFSIPNDAQAFIGGSVVNGQDRLRAGDSLEFLVRHGRKGGVAKNAAESKRAGKLIPPDR